MSSDEQVTLPDGVDKDKAVRLMRWLIGAESDNDKTGRLTDNEMIHKIAKQIQGDVKCL